MFYVLLVRYINHNSNLLHSKHSLIILRSLVLRNPPALVLVLQRCLQILAKLHKAVAVYKKKNRLLAYCYANRRGSWWTALFLAISLINYLFLTDDNILFQATHTSLCLASSRWRVAVSPLMPFMFASVLLIWTEKIKVNPKLALFEICLRAVSYM